MAPAHRGGRVQSRRCLAVRHLPLSSRSYVVPRTWIPASPKQIVAARGSVRADALLKDVDILQRAAEPQPVVVLLDDAHWADAGSVHLLRHVVSHIDPDTHILVLVTYRDTDIDRSHPLSGALADLYRAAGNALG